MRKYLLLTIALLLFLNVDAQLKRSAVNPTHLPPMSLVKPTPVVAEAKMAEPGYAVKKAPQRDSAPSIYYRRPAGAFPACAVVEDGYFAGIFNAPRITVTPYVNYTFNGTINGLGENYAYEWGVKYYDSDSESDESIKVTGQNLVWKWGIEAQEAPIFYAINGNDTLSWQSHGYHKSGDSIVAEPSYIFSHPNFNALWEGYDILKSSKSFCNGGLNGDQLYLMTSYSGANPYGNNENGWWFGKNGGASDSVRIDGIAQAFEKPTVPYKLNKVVVNCAVLEVTGNVKMTCKVYKLDEIPAYDESASVTLSDEPGELIAKGEAIINSQTDDQTGGLVFFTLLGEDDGLQYEITPTIDCPILVVIDGYNDPEMANLTDFTAMISTDIHVDEGFGELAYLKYGEMDQEGNIDYVWKGLNNFFWGAPELKTGLTIFLSTENHFLTFKYDEENGQYNFPAEGGELVKQFGGITRNYIDFFTSIPFDDGYDWWMICDGSDELPDWLHINLADGEWNWDDDIPTGVVTASVTADPLPSDESYREAVVRFHIPGTYIDYKFTQGEASPVYLRGDVNGDGEVTIKDVTALIDYLLSDDASSIILSNADVDANGIVNIADVTCLIDHLLSGSWPDDPVTPPEEHEWVDLGLPSGTLWATCNVGANSPEDYGDYFAWGETEPKEFYYWNTYKWCNSSNITLSKYCTDSSFGNNGFVDDKTELDPEDDAAYVNWGENWCMPTLIQQDELRMQCIWTWTTLNGVNGWLVTGPNGNSMFLPAAGMRTHRSLGGIGSNGRYWSRTLNSSHPDWVYNLYPTSTNVYQSHHQRCDGFTVRAVRNSQEPVELFQLSETEVNLEVGESKVIDILNGCGSYSVDGGAGYVTTDVVGNQLILTGVAAGSDNVIVTDAATNATASLSVTVTNPDTIQTTVFTVNGVSFTMVTVEGGTFTMGATAEQGDDAEEDEYPPHQVTLSNYAIGQTEVTQELWEAVMDENPSSIYGSGFNCPVDMIDAYWGYFIDRLRKLTGWKFRLPTEAEWEFAARGGNRSRDYKYAGSDNLDEVAWYRDNTSGSPESLYFRPVATKAPNELGLYDMSGNVRELCSDWYGEYSSEPQTNPTGPSPDSIYINVFRGGDSFDIDTDCRVSRRIQDSPYWTSPGGGFRLALDIDAGPMMCLSEAEVDLKVGETRTIDILHGSGNYHVGYNQYLNVSTVGDQLVLTGVKEGVTDVSVYDMVKEDVSKVSVTITKPDSIQIEHEWVDLGLPSGTLWATCNVGANAPEEYGDYFAWGETEPKEVYTWNTYKWGSCIIYSEDWDDIILYRYNTDEGFGTVDNIEELATIDDAAYENWGPLWRMPSIDQLEELYDECYWEWTMMNGVYGNLITGHNGNTLFLPFAGYCNGDSINDVDSEGYYWSRTLNSSYPLNAYGLRFDNEPAIHWWNWPGDRPSGYTVRAVRASQEPVELFQLSATEVSIEVGESKIVDILNGSGNYTVDGGTDCVSSTFNGNQLILTGISEGTAELIVTDVTTQANASIFVSVTDSDTIQTMTFTVNGVSFTMVKVEGGTFMMGATEDQGWYGYNQNSLPVHEVTLSTYYIGMTEVTQELWMAVMGENPSYHHGNLQYPVEYVSWNSCQTFLANLSSITGRQFRLPTEAEWEFAARGGIKTQGYKYSGSNDLNLVGWYMDNAFNGTSVVGAKMSNELGLFDMSGNVYEWCYDWYGEYSSEAQFNPTGPVEGTRHVHRGGGCNDGDSFSIISCRDGWGISPQSGSSQIGLRLALQYE